MADKQKYWLGPGYFGSGKNALKPGDPIPKNFSKENFKRFAKKIGEKIEVGIIEDIITLKEKIKKLNPEKLEALEKENNELIETIEVLKDKNLKLTEKLKALGKGGE